VFRNKKLVRGLVAKIRKAERLCLEALQNGRIEHEPTLTDRLLGSMELALNGERIGGVRWAAKTLTDRTTNSQESEFGADFMAVFQASPPDFEIAKGFLAQGKRLEPGQSFARAEARRLKDQCEKMLSHSAASYVFIYSQQSGILVVPATEVVAARDCNPHELTAMPMGKFYEHHFECFIGDRAIDSPTPAGLAELRAKFSSTSALPAVRNVKLRRSTDG
jgi:hypothetical protein